MKLLNINLFLLLAEEEIIQHKYYFFRKESYTEKMVLLKYLKI